MNRGLFILLLALAVSIAAGSQVFAADKTHKKTSKEVHLRLGPGTEAPSVETFETRPSRFHRLTVLKHRHLAKPRPRHRHPELSSEHLVVVALDMQGQEVGRVIIPDPRLLRAETAEPSGELRSQLIYRETSDFSVALPDHPGISELKIYHPEWTGTQFVLELLGQTALP